jgi:hypothetical protein
MRIEIVKPGLKQHEHIIPAKRQERESEGKRLERLRHALREKISAQSASAEFRVA